MSFPNVSIGNLLLWHKRIGPPVKPKDDSRVVIPAKAGIQKRMDPHFHGDDRKRHGGDRKSGFPVKPGMTEKSTDMTVELSFPRKRESRVFIKKNGFPFTRE